MAGEHVLELSDETFDEQVLNADVPVLIDFWAEWCGPCKALTPVIEDLAEEYGDKIKVCKVNTDANREISVRFSISAIPTVMLFTNGEIREKFVGLRNKKEFQAILDRVIAGH